MQENADYFVNHAAAVRWPFTIYHEPIEREIKAVASRLGENAVALNLGCGLFPTYPELKRYASWSACDIDARAVREAGQLNPGLKTFVCAPVPVLGEDAYDLIVAKEVIEHVLETREWIEALFCALKTGGKILLSTPNYGLSLLPVLEYTVLEVIARTKGFSRFHIHPTKFSKSSLKNTLENILGSRADVEVSTAAYGMVLLALITKK